MRALDLIRRAARKPPHVIAYRAIQEARLQWTTRSNGWRTIEEAATTWSARRKSTPPLLIATDAQRALARSADLHLVDPRALTAPAHRIMRREFAILGSLVPSNGAWPWHSDWRLDRVWEPEYFRAFEFYEARERPYDVKYPWELSRLLFLLPVAMQALVERDRDAADFVLATIEDWRRHNPLAHSVNWYPMEASMRTVALVLIQEMLEQAGISEPHGLRRLAALVAMHGAFVARTLEVSDVCGNHYAANIVALLLAALSCPGFHEATNWNAVATKAIEQEITAQILPDGADFEKSTSYHRLVGELFLLAYIAKSRTGAPFSEIAGERLRRAAVFTNSYTRPDGLAANIGDNDDACVLQFDDVPARDHRSFAALSAAFFADDAARPDRFSVAIPAILGCTGVSAWQDLAPRPASSVRHFAAGGYVTARHHGHFFIADIGEVGLAGRGGHGHNDILSFELALDGAAVAVDSGSYMYTGDLQSRPWFQSTAAHNTLRIDGREIAEIRGPWAIDGTAMPLDVTVAENDDELVVHAAHNGYLRLPSPAIHRRTWKFRSSGRLRVEDEIESGGAHRVERFLHFPPGASVAIEPRRAVVASGDGRFEVVWDVGDARVENGWVAESYGVREKAAVLVLENETEGKWTSWFDMSATN